MKLKRWLAALLVWTMVLPMMVTASPAITAKAAGSEEIMVASLVSYTTKEKILARINEIRKEACNEGISFEGKTLKPSDYVELTWSTDMEEIAMTRAVEAYYSFSHTRPDGSSCFSARSSTGLTSSCEIIASMGNALGDIELWYMEKEDLLNGDEDKAGHYIAMIEPGYKSFGMASSGVSVGEFSPASFVGTGRDKQIFNRNAYLNVNIAVDPDNVDVRLLGSDKVSTTGTNNLLLGLIVYKVMSWNPDILQVMNVTWNSSDPDVISVDENGMITGHKRGTATITALAGNMTYSLEVTAVDGKWKKNSGGWWYDLQDGDYPRQQFMDIDGHTYFFDSKGYMATGWKKLYGDWFYFGSNGVARTGWQKIEGKWFYFDKTDAYMYTGWNKIDGKWFLFSDGGVMRTGWVKSGGKWYYFSGGGVMQTGWLKQNNQWFYLTDSGAMQTGWMKKDDLYYYFSDGGVMQTGWVKSNGKWYYLNNSGYMATSKWIGNFYVKEDGVMATDEWIGEYYVGPDGKWVKGKTR
ncbi:MAG: Ig-like domain-containing protein [Lachnospiraceae bacterium]|nr:Ig-like domain-containing protein [Lachnospiraceae bacterium]